MGGERNPSLNDMPQDSIFTPSACYLCKEEAQVQAIGLTFLVDCARCGAYEIEAVATTLPLKNYKELTVHLEEQRKAGKVRPLIFRELVQV